MSAKWPTSIATDADLYVAVNALATTLASTITDSQTTISLASTTGFPTAGAVLIDQEIVFYTGISGNDLTGCIRGADGTVQAAHTAGVPVSHTVVAVHHNNLKDEIEAIETSLNLTASRALASSASGRIEVSSVTAAELAYLSGVTSAIQDQLNGKQPAGTYIANPLTANLSADGSYKITNLAAGTTNGDSLRYEQVIGQFLALSGGTLTGALLLADGTLGSPSLSFGSDPDTGFYSSAANQLGLSVGGTLVGLFTSTQFRAQVSFRAIDGTAAAPAISFINDPDTGIFSVAANQLAFTVGGVQCGKFNDNGAFIAKGTNTNDSVGAGFIGEFVESINSSGSNAPSSGNYGDITSISLTAGDWDVCGLGWWNASGATWTTALIGISTTSGDSATGLVAGSTSGQMNFASTSTIPSTFPVAIPLVRFSLASTTTIYLKMRASYSAGTPVAFGSIRARRVR